MRSLFYLLVALCILNITLAKKQRYRRDLYSSIHEFSCNLFQKVADGNKGNLVMSPSSFAIGLAAAADGANDHTRTVMRNTLQIKSYDETYYEFKIRVKYLSSSNDIRFGNSIFLSSNLTINENYKNGMRFSHGTNVQSLDFTKPNEAVSVVNELASSTTENKITEIFTEGDIQENMKMIILNFIHFESTLLFKFDPKVEHEFCLSDSTCKNVAGMSLNRKLNNGNLTEFNARFVEFPYLESEFTIIIVYPNEVDGLANIEQNLKAVTTLISGERVYSQVEVSIPKFNISTLINLNKFLANMGMEEIFTERADFRNIAEAKFKIDGVYQKAAIVFNEDGHLPAYDTETADKPASLAPESLQHFDVKHPFLAIVRFRNENLFVARIADPTF